MPAVFQQWNGWESSSRGAGFLLLLPLREKGLTMQRTMLKSKLHRVTVTQRATSVHRNALPA